MGVGLRAWMSTKVGPRRSARSVGSTGHRGAGPMCSQSSSPRMEPCPPSSDRQRRSRAGPILVWERRCRVHGGDLDRRRNRQRQCRLHRLPLALRDDGGSLESVLSLHCARCLASRVSYRPRRRSNPRVDALPGCGTWWIWSTPPVDAEEVFVDGPVRHSVSARLAPHARATSLSHLRPRCIAPVVGLQ